jgi:hypothetical protein
MTVDGQSMCIALSLASTHRIAVLRGASDIASRAMFGTCHFITLFGGDALTIRTGGRKQA